MLLAIGNDISNAISKMLTINTDLNGINSQLARLENTIERVEQRVNAHESRLVWLETLRDADKAEIRAEVAQFKADIDRAAQRLLPPSS